MRSRPVFFAALLLADPAGLVAADDPKKDELPPADPNANKLTSEEAQQGWKLLFDGKALTGLRALRSADPLKSGWKIDRNALVLPKEIKTEGKVTGGDLMSTMAFDDFEFRFDFRLAASADSGVLYFARSVMGQKPSGSEYQLIDDVHHPDGLKGGDIKRTGSLYGLLPRAEGAFIRMAERWNEEHWNHGRIIVQGRHVEHWLNGTKCLEYDLGPDLLRKVAAQKVKAPAGFGVKTKSPIVLLDQGTEVAFRNLKIRQLVPAATATPAPAPVPPRPGVVPPSAPTAPNLRPLATPPSLPGRPTAPAR